MKNNKVVVAVVIVFGLAFAAFINAAFSAEPIIPDFNVLIRDDKNVALVSRDPKDGKLIWAKGTDKDVIFLSILQQYDACLGEVRKRDEALKVAQAVKPWHHRFAAWLLAR